MIGWARCQGVRARALNALGEHARAKDTCLYTLEYLTDEDLTFCGNNLGVLVELARAEAGLSDTDAAEARLRELLKEYARGDNPVTLGTLHEALAEIALSRQDREAFLREAEQVDRYFRTTRHPALVARAQRLRQTLRVEGEHHADPANDVSPHLMTVLHNLRHGGDLSLSGSAEWALRQLTELTDVDEAHLFVRDDAAQGAVSCVASFGETHSLTELSAWVGEQLRLLGGEVATCTMAEGDEDAPLDARFAELGGKAYQLILLRAGADAERIVGVLVLPRAAQVPYAVVREIGARIDTSVSVL